MQGHDEEQGYYSVGELARRVGVTVRTIQYYDQAGLLSPSAKGNQNKRLYTEADVQELNRILLLKFLGMSLKQIKDAKGKLQDPTELRALIDKKTAETQDEMRGLLDRMTTLRVIGAKSESAGVTWAQLVKMIDENEDHSDVFWRLTCVSDDVRSESKDPSRPLAPQWHEVIVEALRLMDADEASIDPEAVRNLAERYRRLCENGNFGEGENFILMDNIPSHGYDDDSFDSLRRSVFAYLQRIAERS